MYYLMNKDNIIATFEIRQGVLGKTYDFSHISGKLPYGFATIESWLDNRKASKHNSHLKKLMVSCGCDKNEGFIKVTHAASINDTFWIKSDQETLKWSDISFYQNKFDEVVSKLAFEGIGLYGLKLSGTSPELSTGGTFRKCWMKEADGIWLYKRGQTGARNVGLEPYGEMLGSEIARKICRDDRAVKYEVKALHGELASRCKLFTDETLGYVPYSQINPQKFSPDEMLAFYSSIDEEDLFRRMIVTDALTFNIDRHAGNHGVLIDNDTLEPVKMAPVFDMNLSMLPYLERDDFEHIGNSLLDYAPLIGEDFTRIGQLVLTPSIRADLINMKGFQFAFRGDDKYPEWRIKKMEEIIDRQIEALLSKEHLYTKDVFVPKKQKEIPDGNGEEIPAL
ncbi:MAG: hypothetical protein LUC99_02340 [Clostridiales bacterium]|nr:hypothetical protein [Clostridiales bacterium]